MKRIVLLIILLALAFGVIGIVSLAGFFDFLSPAASEGPEESEWHLLVDGFVHYSLNLTFEELVAMPRSTVDAELICVDAPAHVLAKRNWTGVRLGAILERAEVSSEAVKIAFYAADGFSTDLTVTTAMREDVVLAYETDGEPLPEKLRLVVPGKWGYKWISQLVHIELVNYDFKGSWESRGYSDSAEIS
ncbi:MAG: molybdopterin-dependent oxidoreductase [Candidatus Bathyarchaeota archaeon]|nr:MAG: molybdopterin-dependent oxidoreductase [Candidatus Bathyarchaeota archaeon]